MTIIQHNKVTIPEVGDRFSQTPYNEVLGYNGVAKFDNLVVTHVRYTKNDIFVGFTCKCEKTGSVYHGFETEKEWLNNFELLKRKRL